MKKAKADPTDEVEVVLDLERLHGPRLVGRLHRQKSRKGELLSFEYERSWLKHPGVFALDPELLLVRGRAYPGNENFGIFLDSAPDRWGRVLMDRRAAVRARKQGAPSPTLTNWDYLLGVHDDARLGALRFRRGEGAPFLDDDGTQAGPPISSLSELQGVSLKLEAQDADEQSDYECWLGLLVAPGSSLGGARPKAAVRDEEGHLCIAKFPSARDSHDVGGWETVVHRLAKKAGVEVPAAQALRLGQLGHTFICRRFDRTSTGGRKLFVSAMTLLQRQDGDSGASYLELVELLQARGAQTGADCAQLFRRVVFNICTKNTDDHLRNHGFFIEPQGLVLAPAFDMNPNPQGRELTLAIDEVNPSCDVEVALEAASSYGLSGGKAKAIIEEVREAVLSWRSEAEDLDIPKKQRNQLEAAFKS